MIDRSGQVNRTAPLMPHAPHAASLKGFARTGRLGPLALGMSRAEVRDALGPPMSWLAGKRVERSPLWKYGDAELYFDAAEKLEVIHFDWFEVPTGGPTLELHPWVIRRGLPLPQLEAALRAEGIDFGGGRDRWNPECVRVVTAARVDFLVQVEGDADELGLWEFGCPAS